MTTRGNKLGVWLVGAIGGVGSTVALGLAALQKRLVDYAGLVSALPEFATVPLVNVADIVLGGHEVRSESLVEAVRALHRRANVFDSELITRCTPILRNMQKNICPGTLYGVGEIIRTLPDIEMGEVAKDRSAAEAVERLTADLVAFRKKHQLKNVVVIHVASSEPTVRARRVHGDFAALSKALGRRGECAIPTSSLYALAAIESGCAYVNFTPSTGMGIPAIESLAIERNLPFMGNDGKTGETLVKSVLAPLFRVRHLDVLSWFGQNILGNRDGAVLRDPVTRASKIRSKDRTVARILGKSPATQVGIDFVPSLDDWKVAWDFIHFRGFLDTRMHMQFIWHGCDSLLAAPLIIDLARFAELEIRAGRGGPMRHLACFFKDPIGETEYDLFSQWQRLLEHVKRNSRETSL